MTLNRVLIVQYRDFENPKKRTRKPSFYSVHARVNFQRQYNFHPWYNIVYVYIYTRSYIIVSCVAYKRKHDEVFLFILNIWNGRKKNYLYKREEFSERRYVKPGEMA